MNELVKAGLHAFDIDMLSKAYHLRALIHIFFNNYESAIQDFKT